MRPGELFDWDLTDLPVSGTYSLVIEPARLKHGAGDRHGHRISAPGGRQARTDRRHTCPGQSQQAGAGGASRLRGPAGRRSHDRCARQHVHRQGHCHCAGAVRWDCRRGRAPRFRSLRDSRVGEPAGDGNLCRHCQPRPGGHRNTGTPAVGRRQDLPFAGRGLRIGGGAARATGASGVHRTARQNRGNRRHRRDHPDEFLPQRTGRQRKSRRRVRNRPREQRRQSALEQPDCWKQLRSGAPAAVGLRRIDEVLALDSRNSHTPHRQQPQHTNGTDTARSAAHRSRPCRGQQRDLGRPVRTERDAGRHHLKSHPHAASS